MLQGETSKLSRASVTELAKVLGNPTFKVVGEMLRVHGKCLEHYAHKLEGCWCHGHVWTQKCSHKRNVTTLHGDCGHTTCAWKGRMGPWFVAEGFRALCAAIGESSSERLHMLFTDMRDAAGKATLLEAQGELRRSLVEELQDKLSFWNHMPYKALGVFHGCCGGSRATSKRLLRECLEEHDVVVAGGDATLLHRVSKRLFDKAQVCRQELDAYLEAHNEPLEAFYTAYAMLQEYALASLVERRIEQVHSLIKRGGASMTFALPPYICARLREAMHLKRLGESREFHDMCVAEWRSRSMLDRLLHQRVAQSHLNEMTRLEKIKIVYECSLQSEFQGTALPRQTESAWQMIAKGIARVSDKSPAWQACVSYWKSSLEPGGFYSLPADLYQAALEGGPLTDVEADPVWEGICGMAALTSQVEWANSATICIFQVINVRPEARTHVRIGHAPASTTSIHVSLCTLVSCNIAQETCVVVNDTQSHVCLNANALVKHMRRAVGQCFRWCVAGKRASLKTRPPQAALVGDADAYDLPPAIGIAAASPPKSEALAVSVDVRQDCAEHRILAEMLHKQAFISTEAGPVSVFNLATMNTPPQND